MRFSLYLLTVAICCLLLVGRFVGRCELVAELSWSLLGGRFVSDVVGRSLCRLVAIGRSLCVGCCGLVTACQSSGVMGRLLCRPVAVGCCCWSVTLYWSLCVGHFGSVALCRSLWVSRCRSIAMLIGCYVGWSLCLGRCVFVAVSVGSCELVGLRPALWVGRYVGWLLWVGRCAGWSLYAGRCGSVAVSVGYYKSSAVGGCCGLIAVGWSLCWSVAASVGRSMSGVVGWLLCVMSVCRYMSVNMDRLLWVGRCDLTSP